MCNNNTVNGTSRFFSGDYEYLCKMYGLSGASGRTQDLNLIIAHHQMILQGVTVACGAPFPAVN